MRGGMIGAADVRVIVARMFALFVPDRGSCYRPQPGKLCPSCGGATGDLALLTATEVYFTCTACRHRWDDRRTPPRRAGDAPDDGPDVDTPVE